MFLTSLYFAITNFWQTTETYMYSPQTFSVTAAVVAPAVVICLNSLLCACSICILSTCNTAISFDQYCTMKGLEIFLLTPGWNASPLRGIGIAHTQVHVNFVLHLVEERHSESTVSCLNTTKT